MEKNKIELDYVSSGFCASFHAQVQKLAPVLPWAQELLDSVYLEPEIQDLIAQLK